MSKMKNELAPKAHHSKSDKNDPLMPLRHTAEHILHTAMQELYPSLKKAMGPAIEDGFYFDFDLEEKINQEDFQKIEARMQEIIDAKLPITHKELSVQEAEAIFKNNPYKMNWLKEIQERGEKVSVYLIGKEGDEHFDLDLCGGPHAKNTGEVKAFKLLSVAGAYWKGDSDNKMLQRIYGTAWETKENLEQYLNNIEEAKRRDHRKLGKDLDLFTFSEYIGSGLPLYTPKGALIRRALTQYVEDLQSKEDYTQVWTPQIAKAELFKISGHYDKYKDDMFKVVSNYSDEEFYLKPMNCPQHTQIYASKQRSYRDLPIRLTDFAMLYRDEKPGELNGLARVRSFSQDDCHIFCTEEQVDEEIDKALNMTKQVMQTFGFKYRYRLSTRDTSHPEKYLGDPQTWDKVEAWAEKIMKRNNIDYYDGPGEAAFYAPKMDLMATDALGREWQLSTVQIDYVMPQRFNLNYVDKDGSQKHPVMLHRAIIGSPERFIMILLEHFGGAFPVWLSPLQVVIVPIADKHIEYAQTIMDTLKEQNIRVEIDSRDEKMQGKIRDAQLKKVPYMLVVGDREMEKNEASVRLRTGEDLKSKPIAEITAKISSKYLTKAMDLW